MKNARPSIFLSGGSCNARACNNVGSDKDSADNFPILMQSGAGADVAHKFPRKLSPANLSRWHRNTSRCKRKRLRKTTRSVRFQPLSIRLRGYLASIIPGDDPNCRLWDNQIYARHGNDDGKRSAALSLLVACSAHYSEIARSTRLLNAHRDPEKKLDILTRMSDALKKTVGPDENPWLDMGKEIFHLTELPCCNR